MESRFIISLIIGLLISFILELPILNTVILLLIITLINLYISVDWEDKQ